MTDPLYENYWKRKRLISEQCPAFRLIHSSGHGIDGELLALICAALKEKVRVLDVGAGSMKVRDTLIANGFNAQYETLDIGEEYEYTYRSLDEAPGIFDAILLLDVLEHIPLRDGLTLLQQLTAQLRVGGALIVQTPNGRCVRSPFSSDMTHVQAYNLPDLWAYLSCLNFDAVGYRVAFRSPRRFATRLTEFAGRAVVTRLLGLDYADNILLIACKRC